MGNALAQALFDLGDMTFTARFMRAGGCLEEFNEAMRACRGAAAAAGADDGEDVKACVEATAALRKCMEANQPMFKHYIRTLDEGLEDNERRGYGVQFDDDEKGLRIWRWWCNMRRK